MEKDIFIERKILIGLITNTEYINQIRGIYQTKLIASAIGKRIASWCIDHYDKYGTAPGKMIEDIYEEKARKGLPKDICEELEEEFLPRLSEEFEAYESDTNNPEALSYLVDQTNQYFIERQLIAHTEKIQALLESGDTEAAQSQALNFKGIIAEEDTSLNFASEKALQSVENAFLESGKPLIHFPKDLGKFWDDQFIRGALIAIWAIEKRGKSFLLMDIAKRAVSQGNKVAFFQAGDMTENAQIRRFCIHLAKASDNEKYCGKMFEPVVDCIKNQLNSCQYPDRECDFGVFEDSGLQEKDLKYSITFDQLKEAYLDNPDYSPCHNCREHSKFKLGTPWLKEVEVKSPLTVGKAKALWKKHFITPNRPLRLSSHPMNTLSVSKIKTLLDSWEKKEGFIPDVIIIDYADLLVPDTKQEFRHQQNEIWKSLRNLSQEPRGEKQPLVITPSQADAAAYKSNKLTIDNFSEDKRKNAHPTAIYSLDQDTKGREKTIGIMRIGTIILREGEFTPSDYITVTQNLRRGMPIISSYF